MGNRLSGALCGILIYEEVHRFNEKVQNSAISVSAIRAFSATLFREKARLPIVESEKYSNTVNITNRNSFFGFQY